jgi:hypothetical protein
MSVGESLGSHSLNLFADFLQFHLDSPEASSRQISSVKPINPVKQMASGKSAKKGGRQR